MADEPEDKKKPGPKPDPSVKENLKSARENAESNKKTLKLAELRANIEKKASIEQANIKKLIESGNVKQAQQAQSQLDAFVAAAATPNNENQLAARLQDLNTLGEQIAQSVETTNTGIETAINNDEQLQSLKALNERMSEQNQLQADTLETQEKIENLNGFFGRTSTAETRELQRSFTEAQAMLTAAVESGDATAEAIALETLNELGKQAGNIEKERENAKIQDEQNSTLSRIASSSESMAGKFDDFASNVGGGAGFVGLLLGIGLATGVIDPEAFAEKVKEVFTNIKNTIRGIIGIFTGEEGSLDLIKENVGTFFGLLGGLALVLGGPILRGLAMLMKVAKVVRAFILMQWVPGMIAMLSGMMASFMAMLMNPVGLIVLGIAAAFAAFGLILVKIRDAMGFSSIGDVIILTIAVVKDAMNEFINVFIKIGKKVASLAGGIAGVLGFEVPAFISNLADKELLPTDNAVKKKAELKEKARQEQIEQNEAEIEQEIPPLQGAEGIDLSQVSGISAEDMAATQGQNFDLNQAQLGGQPILNQVSRGGNTQVDNSSQVTTILESPRTATSNVLGSNSRLSYR